MHTAEISCWIPSSAYFYLSENLPSLTRVSERVMRSNYYAAKGITQLELREFQFVRNGLVLSRYYLVMRLNLAAVMGDNQTFLIDLEKYSPDEIMERLQKRIFEINELRFIRLHQLPVSIFLANRVDIAQDILTDYPQLLVWLCNMSFPFNYRNMERKAVHKEIDKLYHESCCFCNGSRGINIYHKMSAMLNTGQEILTEERERIEHLIRFEVQVKKRGIYGMKLPTQRSLKPFLEREFCSEYVLKVSCSIFGTAPFVSEGYHMESQGEPLHGEISA